MVTSWTRAHTRALALGGRRGTVHRVGAAQLIERVRRLRCHSLSSPLCVLLPRRPSTS